MIYQQSVFDTWPIESESIQAIITSPPYFALRKYAIPDVIIGGAVMKIVIILILALYLINPIHAN